MTTDGSKAPSTRRRKLLLVIGAIAGALLVVSVSVAALVAAQAATSAANDAEKVRRTQLDGTPLGKRIVEIAEKIDSCTDPEGACAKRGAKSTGEAIASINQYGLYVVTCADQPGQQTESELRQCADRLQATSHQERRKP